jgi:hypothetical protein
MPTIAGSQSLNHESKHPTRSSHILKAMAGLVPSVRFLRRVGNDFMCVRTVALVAFSTEVEVLDMSDCDAKNFRISIDDLDVGEVCRLYFKSANMKELVRQTLGPGDFRFNSFPENITLVFEVGNRRLALHCPVRIPLPSRSDHSPLRHLIGYRKYKE